MLAVGVGLMTLINDTVPAGQSGMTEEEIFDLMLAEQENRDYNTLAGILIGVGFLLVLISFGARRRRRDDIKKQEKRPAKEQ